MKSNKEFLDGVYSKAGELEKERTKPYKTGRMYYRFATIAAMIILIPTIFFWNSNRGYEEISSPMMIRTINDSSSYFQEADFIVVGKTEEVGMSEYVKDHNYIYTDINFKIEEILKGQVEESEIILRINGGKVKKEKVWSKMDGNFIEGNNSIVFLSQDEYGRYHLLNSDSQFEEVKKDLFKDKTGQEYSLDEIKDIIKMED